MAELTIERSLRREWRAKYNAEELADLKDKGHTLPGGTSYPIDDKDDLEKAIKAVGRGNADHDAIRKYIIGRADEMKLSNLIPNNWEPDGSLKEENSVWSTLEERETYNDARQAVESAISDSLPKKKGEDIRYVYVVDMTDQWAVYEYEGDLWQVDYELSTGGDVTLGDKAKVRRITTYEANSAGSSTERRATDDEIREDEAAGEGEQRTAAWAAKERRKARAELVEGMPERRFWQEAWGPVGLELRDRPEGIIQVGGYASVTECWYEVGDYEERAVRGFCRRSLGEKPDLMFLANHADMPMGRTKNGSLRLEEPHKGLRYDVDLQLYDPDVKRLLPKLEREDMDESSFAFRARDQEWDADYRKRSLIDVSLHKGDVSIVNYGANPAASAGLRAFEDLGVEHLGEAVMEARAGKAISSKNEAQIKDAIGKLQALLPQESEPESPAADPLAVLIPTGVEAERARRARAIARAA